MLELTCERKFAVWRSLEGPQGEPFQPSVHEMESMSTEPDTGGLLLRPKSVQLVPVIFEKDEEPPEPSRGGVSCSLEKLMTGIRSLFRGEVLRVYREQEREARASISLGGTHTHYVQYDWNRSQLIVSLVQPIYLQCLCIGLRNKRPSLDYCCAIHSLLCVCWL